MSRIGELVDQVAALKQRSDELEAAMATTDEQADEVAEAFGRLGAEGKAAQLSEVKMSLSRARNSRWLSEGHLEEALSALQMVISGQKGIGTSLKGLPHTGTAKEGPKPEHGPLNPADGSRTIMTEFDSQPVKLIYVPPEAEQELKPSGEELLHESAPRNRFDMLARTMVKEDASDPAKSLAESMQNITSLFRNEAAPPPKPPATGTATEVVQPPPAEVHRVPGDQLSAGNLAVAAIALAVIGMKAGSNLRDAMGSLRSKMKEHRNDGH